MPEASTLAWLKDLGVVAVGLANNHSGDLGPAAFAAMVVRLREAGLTVLEHGLTQQVGPLRVVAWRDLDNHPQPRAALIDPQELTRAAPADLALMHWGREYSAEPGPREEALTAMLQRQGLPLIVGAHPHRASQDIRLWGGLDTVLVYSLGNFIFDQHGPRVSGAVLQISVFAQGTRALRLLALPDARSLVRGR
jgi:poly-gamma-glutamate synthesis protein (capsule biosynthesis protein)